MKRTERLLTFLFLTFFSKALVFAQSSALFPSTFRGMGIGGGGYMYTPSISPHNANHIFVNCDMGGVYRSLDGAATFKMMHQKDLVSTVKGKVQFTSDPNILYAVRRSTLNQNDPFWRGELAKSVDGGATFQSLADPTSSGVHRLEVDPTSTQRMILNEYNQLFFSNNGGSSWTSVFQPANDQLWLGGAFWDGQNIYVGTNHGLLVSKNSGLTFSIENHAGLPSGAGIYQLAGGKNGSTVRLFCITSAAVEMYAWLNPLEFLGKFTGLFRMNYAANASWANSLGNITSGVEINWVDLAKNNIQTIWATGRTSGDAPRIFKSTDAGATWANTFLGIGNENISTGWAGDYGLFNHNYYSAPLGFDVDDANPNHAITTDGGGLTTTDGGATWRATYVKTAFQNAIGQPTSGPKFYQTSGLDVTSVNDVFWLNDQEIFASQSDIGLTFSADAGETWTLFRNQFQPWGASVANNNWYKIVRQPATGELFAAVGSLNDIFIERYSDEIDAAPGLVARSSNNGVKWDTIFNFGHPVVWLEVDKTKPNRIYASVVHSVEGGIFFSDNSGVFWTKMPAPAGTEGHPFTIFSLADGGLVATFCARTEADGVTLRESSGVFYLPAGGSTWQNRTGAGMKKFTKNLVVDPHDPTQNTWYATVWGRFTTWPQTNNAGDGGLFRTTNRGQTWTRIFQAEQTESLTIHPTKPNVAFLSIENNGLFSTENLSSAVPTFQKVPEFPFWRPRRVFFKPNNACEMWVATQGGGLWKGESSGSLVAPTITGAVSSCSDFDAMYSTAPQPNATFFWTVAGGQIVSGQGTNSIFVKWNDSGGGSGSVKVQVAQ